ncbi:MAG: phosphatase PAP2 family protein [Saprospiraceae bacterium]|nr:phosphatase PAP2 family protein [Saprospiraceae bacterium]
MFQVEPVLWLQSLESPSLTWFFSTITNLGYTRIYIMVLIAVMFGLHLRKGLFVFLTIVVCGLFTHAMKNGFQLPRPSDIDSRVIEPGHFTSIALIDGGAADSFLALPSPEARELVKAQTDWSYGFPSGHVSLAAAFMLGLAFFFRSKPFLAFAVVWTLLMALSRMYLGRHFIADVLGGMGVGVFVIALSNFLIRPIKKEGAGVTKIKDLTRLSVFGLLLLLLSPFIELLDKENIGRLFGLVFTIGFLIWLGFPSDNTIWWKRIARVALAFLAFFLFNAFINPYIESMALAEDGYPILFVTALLSFVPLVLIVLGAKALKLYELGTHEITAVDN